MISIVIAAHNERPYLRQAVQSLLDENIADLEIVVVDDGSTDGSLDSIADLPVRALRLPIRRGVAAARNAGMAAARGELLGFLDGDDRLWPGGLRWRRQWLAERPGEAAVWGTIGGWIDGHGRPLGDRLATGFSPPIGDRITWESVRQWGLVQGACWALLLRRRWAERVGLFDATLRRDPDTDWILRLLRLTPVGFVPRPVVAYRVHGGNHTLRGSTLRQNRRTVAETWLANRLRESPP